MKNNGIIERYISQNGGERATSEAAIATPAFKIEVRFLGGLTATQKSAFKRAADRWSRVIVGDLPNIVVDGETIDDVVIDASGVTIDGAGAILGQAGPTKLRPQSGRFLPCKGVMEFDSADLLSMENQGTLTDVITHEMGHVLGIGTIWKLHGVLQGAGTSNPRFTGQHAMAEYGRLKGTQPEAVPVENVGAVGSIDSHWRESVFDHELMSSTIGGPNNPISRLTVASLRDIGYVVDMNAAEPYQLPNLSALAESGLKKRVDGYTLPVFVPRVLPESALQP